MVENLKLDLPLLLEPVLKSWLFSCSCAHRVIHELKRGEELRPRHGHCTSIGLNYNSVIATSNHAEPLLLLQTTLNGARTQRINGALRCFK